LSACGNQFMTCAECQSTKVCLDPLQRGTSPAAGYILLLGDTLRQEMRGWLSPIGPVSGDESVCDSWRREIRHGPQLARSARLAKLRFALWRSADLPVWRQPAGSLRLLHSSRESVAPRRQFDLWVFPQWLPRSRSYKGMCRTDDFKIHREGASDVGPRRSRRLRSSQSRNPD
jgi:hypothetical protein